MVAPDVVGEFVLDPLEAMKLGDWHDFAELADSDISFAEGPAWRKSTGEVFFSDIPKNTIYRWTKADGKSIFKRPAGRAEGGLEKKLSAGSNGLAIAPDGSLIICDMGNRRIARLNEKNFTVDTVANSFCDRLLNETNDVAVSKSGEVFFTDPALWKRRGREAKPEDLDFNGVYRVDTDGKIYLIDICELPNGIALSPDDKTLYVSQSRGENPCWIAYTLAEDRKSFTSKRIFCNMRIWEKGQITGTPDGLAVDKNGFIYATGNGGIHVFSPQLKHLGYIEFENQTTNCCVIEGADGEPEYLFITASKGIYLADIKKILKAAKENM